MTMLCLDWLSEDIVERYSGFTFALTWFRMYCAAAFGKRKQDYARGFRFLQDAYDHLWDTDEQVLPEWEMKPTVTLMKSIKTLVNTKSFADEHVQKIAALIKEYQDKEEGAFRKRYVEGEVEYELKLHYPKGLPEAVRGLLKNDTTDEAVITAFKFLDTYLQKLTSASPYELYGEDLINHAFAPKTGILQLATAPNEQAGVRNFFSGANAIFRNPAAHRFIQRDQFFAAAIVAMVAAMIELASQIAKDNSVKPAG